MKWLQKARLWQFIGLLILIGLAGWIASPYAPVIQAGSFIRDNSLKLGLDLQGGSHLIYRALVDEETIEDPVEALAGVRDVIERRVNLFGVSEPVIQTNRVSGEYRVIVELAGVHDTNTAIQLIGETPQLDFREENLELDLENTDNIITDDLFTRTQLTGKHLQRALVDFDQVTGTPFVTLQFNDEGTELFAEITERNIGKRIAIYLDGVAISAPIVQDQITAGQAVISGGFTLEEAKELSRRLNAGALPVPIELIGQQTIGPSLGATSISNSIRAGVIGLIAVIIWMILFYRLPGFVASIALAIYAVLFIAIIKLLPVTLTLAGIAGLILSIGMAVDANILIFERFREQQRAGHALNRALSEGFTEAWEAIKASNVSSIITGIILYAFGTGLVRGFAVTFTIGIVLSMFTAITITRGLLGTLLHFKILQKNWLL